MSNQSKHLFGPLSTVAVDSFKNTGQHHSRAEEGS